MNRFFYICPSCLFRATAETDGHRAPDAGQCPVCTKAAMKCQGATKGVLRYETPCNDVCTFATGPNCTCSCGGANHGKEIIVPVIGKVIDLSGYPQRPLAELKSDWQKWQRMKADTAAALPDPMKEALADYAAGRRLDTATWNQVIDYNRATRHANGLKLYRLRFHALDEIRARFCPHTTPTTSTADIAPWRASQLALAF